MAVKDNRAARQEKVQEGLMGKGMDFLATDLFFCSDFPAANTGGYEILYLPGQVNLELYLHSTLNKITSVLPSGNKR